MEQHNWGCHNVDDTMRMARRGCHDVEYTMWKDDGEDTIIAVAELLNLVTFATTVGDARTLGERHSDVHRRQHERSLLAPESQDEK